MPGTMSQADLIADLKPSVHDLAGIFNKEAADAAWIRALNNAALDMHRVRPLRKQGEITLEPNKHDYPGPVDLLRVIKILYADQARSAVKPWEAGYAHNIPRAETQYVGDAPMLWLTPAPTAALISVFSSAYPFIYSAKHQVGASAENTTIAAIDRHLLLLRTQAELMKEAAARNIAKPVAVTDSISSVTRNGVPAALYDQLMKDFERQG